MSVVLSKAPGIFAGPDSFASRLKGKDVAS